MLVLLEGNIAAGKTTLGAVLGASEQFTFVPEPVERWQSGFAANLLERFYTDTPRWAFTMQIGAFITRAQTFANLEYDPGTIAVFERSVYCDRYVFAKNLYEQGLMDDTEWAVYRNFWEQMAGMVPVPDAILYLRTPADECYSRLQIRGRAEEKAITLDYLQQLEASHDDWLTPANPDSIPVVVLDGTAPLTADDVWQELNRVALPVRSE